MRSIWGNASNRGGNAADPRYPERAAAELAKNIGDPALGDVLLSRRRLQSLLERAVSLGIAQQVETHRVARNDAKVAQRHRNRRGRRRLWWAIAFGVVTLIGFLSGRDSTMCWGNWRSWYCQFHGLPVAVMDAAGFAACFALISWLIRRVIAWVKLGYEDDRRGDASVQPHVQPVRNRG